MSLVTLADVAYYDIHIVQSHFSDDRACPKAHAKTLLFTYAHILWGRVLRITASSESKNAPYCSSRHYQNLYSDLRKNFDDPLFAKILLAAGIFYLQFHDWPLQKQTKEAAWSWNYCTNALFQ